MVLLEHSSDAAFGGAYPEDRPVQVLQNGEFGRPEQTLGFDFLSGDEHICLSKEETSCSSGA